MPSGAVALPPVIPHTWIEQAGVVYGDPLRAKTLESQVAVAVAWHRQRPLFQGEATVTTSVASATYVPIPLAELVDNVSGHSDSANTSRWAAPGTSTGPDWYLAVGQLPFATSDPTKSFLAALRVNGSTVFEGMKVAGATGHNTTPLVCDLAQLNANDYLELCARQDTAGAVSTTVSSKSATLGIRWVCAGSGTTVATVATPRTWTAADAITADSTGGAKVPLNLHIRDVIRWLNYPPIARITSVGSSQTIPTGAGTWTSIQFPTATVDNYTMWSSGTNTKLTINRAGVYFVYGLAAVAEASGAAGYRASRLLVNGTTVYGGMSSQVATASTAGTQLPAFGHIRLAVNDTIELQMQQNDTGALTVKTGTGDHARLIAVWRSL
jgi:formylmethanofuran dehydrogenase subunit D